MPPATSPDPGDVEVLRQERLDAVARPHDVEPVGGQELGHRHVPPNLVIGDETARPRCVASVIWTARGRPY